MLFNYYSKATLYFRSLGRCGQLRTMNNKYFYTRVVQSRGLWYNLFFRALYIRESFNLHNWPGLRKIIYIYIFVSKFEGWSIAVLHIMICKTKSFNFELFKERYFRRIYFIRNQNQNIQLSKCKILLLHEIKTTS